MDDKLVVKNKDGIDITINVINIYKSDNSEYICYNIDGVEDIFVSRLVENENSFSLESITEEEKEAIEQIISNEMSDKNE